MMTLSEISLHHKAEILLSRLHLKHRGIVIAEMIVCPLPEIRVWGSRNCNSICVDVKALRFASPFKESDVYFSFVVQGFCDPVNECVFRCIVKKGSNTNIRYMSNASIIEVLSRRNYVVMPTDAVELTNKDELYAPNEYGNAEMKYLYFEGEIKKTTTIGHITITTPESVSAKGEITLMFAEVRLLSMEIPKVVTRVQHNVTPPTIETKRFASVILHQL